ncbi:KDO2-lipid IV(A) lauroyltransferase [Rhizobium sp. RU20A]|uniref:lysophospholipid acyltransferase family protein n=1 Tax=Rhizobium sp. RU20A TaxID=1907412 RepID=UPI000954532C|nr:lysophospholipid acyltransferase family protein [Rhizobium sp. RU20A]SIQ18314.1 KDO2-lipid IV(A) lauroyltransferase [Rhizobium sp. RU20A]
MRTTDRTAGLQTRKAFVWQEETPPRLADLMAGGDRRRDFWRYWVRDTLRDFPKRLSHYGLRPLPARVASALGALHYGILGRYYPGISRRMRDNAARIAPERDPEAVMVANWRNKGRLMAEFSVLPRIAAGNGVTVTGAEHLRAARARGPVVMLALHLGNWELISPVMRGLNVPFATFYMPPESRFEHRTACRIRRNFGAELLPPGLTGVRPALKRLAEPDGVVIIFGDEGFDGRIMAPFFGRPVHLAGNLAIAVRLARHAGASILPVHVIREDSARFECRMLEAITLDHQAGANASLGPEVERLNAVIEPVIRAHLDQWFFLDHRF